MEVKMEVKRFAQDNTYHLSFLTSNLTPILTPIFNSIIISPYYFPISDF